MSRRRRNFIPGLSKTQSMAVTAVGTGLLGVLVYWLVRSGKPKLQSIYDWDDTITAVQGMPVVVRVPRGRYKVLSNDVLISAQTDFGGDTHIILIPLKVDREKYEIETTLGETVTNKTYPIEIVAHPAAAFKNPGSHGRRNYYARQHLEA